MWPTLESQQLRSIIGNAEALTRSELSCGQVIDERDYVSAFCARVRVASAQGKLSAHSQNLPNSISQTIGADFLLVVHDGVVAKLAILEAKWPRAFTKPNAIWDKAPGGKSHFSSQLNRQKLAPEGAFVGEFFINESPVGTHTSLLNSRGGTVVPHASAYAFDALRQDPRLAWKTHDFWELHGYARQEITTLRDLVFGLAVCHVGDRLPLNGGTLALTSLDGNVLTNIRLGTANDHEDDRGNDRDRGAKLLVIQLPRLG